MIYVTKYIKKSNFQNHFQNKPIPYLKALPITGIFLINGKATYVPSRRKISIIFLRGTVNTTLAKEITANKHLNAC